MNRREETTDGEMTTSRNTITFNRSYWKIPSVETAFSGILEGKPTDIERKKIIEKTLRDREAWKPSSEAWGQYEQMEDAVGKEIEVQLWDPIMFLLEEEAPFPILAQCDGLRLLVTEEGKQQAYLVVKNIRCLKTPEGYDGRSRLKSGDQEGEFLLPLAEIYTIIWESEIFVDARKGKSMSYSDTIKRHLAAFKMNVLEIRENGFWRDVEYDHILPRKYRNLNILPEYRQLFFVSEYAKPDEMKIKYHMYFHHLNSSQAMCINLFFPLIAEGLLNLITEYLGIEGGDDLRATFEKESTIEKALQNEATSTYFDYHLQCASSTCSDIFFEVKYTENGFGKATPDDNHKKKFQDIYLPYVNNSTHLSDTCKNEKEFLKNYQMLRNLIHIDKNKYVVILIPYANSIARIETEKAQKKFLNDYGRRMVKIIFLEEFITFLETKSNNVALYQYYSAFRRKYLPG